MSATMLRRALMLLALACASTETEAQDIATLEARVRRLDSLVASRYRALRLDGDSANRRAGLRDIVVGGYRVQVTPALAEVAGHAATKAWDRVERRGGSWLARELPRYTVLVFPSPGLRGWVTIEAVGGASTPGLRLDTRPDEESITNSLVRMTDLLLARALWASLQWVGESSEWDERTAIRMRPDENGWFPAVLGADVDSASDAWARIARQIRLVPSRSNRTCLLGDASACLTSLGIGVGDRRAASRWYDPSDYPWLVASASLDISTPPGKRERAAQCLRDKREDACATLVNDATRGVPLPTDQEAKGAFLALALDMGGAEALDRLVSSTEPLEARLANTAGRAVQDVARTWQSRLTSATPDVSIRQITYWTFAIVFAAALIVAGSRRVLA